MIEYTAKRTFAPGHTEGQICTFDVDVTEALPQIKDIKQIARSPGGASEVSFQRQDVYWTITLAPVRGANIALLREFLDSTESGETFNLWLTPEDISALVLKREEASHAESAFMRCGSSDLDLFTAQFTGLQAVPYDITGLQPQPGGGSGGYDGGGGSTSDPYDPEDGGPTGGLDPAPIAPPVLSSPTPSGTLDTYNSAVVGATTDQNSGTFYVVLGNGSELTGVTAAQIKAGQKADGSAATKAGNSSVSTTSPSVTLSGLTADADYTYAVVQNNADGDSNLLDGSFHTAVFVSNFVIAAGLLLGGAQGYSTSSWGFEGGVLNSNDTSPAYGVISTYFGSGLTSLQIVLSSPSPIGQTDFSDFVVKGTPIPGGSMTLDPSTADSFSQYGPFSGQYWASWNFVGLSGITTVVGNVITYELLP